jgi:hypothetical protein
MEDTGTAKNQFSQEPEKIRPQLRVVGYEEKSPEVEEEQEQIRKKTERVFQYVQGPEQVPTKKGLGDEENKWQQKKDAKVKIKGIGVEHTDFESLRSETAFWKLRNMDNALVSSQMFGALIQGRFIKNIAVQHYGFSEEFALKRDRLTNNGSGEILVQADAEKLRIDLVDCTTQDSVENAIASDYVTEILAKDKKDLPLHQFSEYIEEQSDHARISLQRVTFDPKRRLLTSETNFEGPSHCLVIRNNLVMDLTGLSDVPEAQQLFSQGRTEKLHQGDIVLVANQAVLEALKPAYKQELLPELHEMHRGDNISALSRECMSSGVLNTWLFLKKVDELVKAKYQPYQGSGSMAVFQVK